MTDSIIDSHIHFDLYNKKNRLKILEDTDLSSMITVSSDLKSGIMNLNLAQDDQRIKPALGYHPEQPLPSEEEIQKITVLARRYKHRIAAIGEVGLPYYLRKEDPSIDLGPYVTLLEYFIKLAAELDKPIVLHAIYEDADLVCGLLQKHGIRNAHFHWFKGSSTTIQSLIKNHYYISVTPDCVYKSKSMNLIEAYPLNRIMVETDGPWPFEGPFKGKLTHPGMIHDSISKISEIKRLPIQTVYSTIYQNTTRFFRL
ncbi:TatD DNase family protein [Halobacillus alkaliphilus]|uniref:TatD DNase family protein n=1 Tax=Halobacillus alkaliphilus TaxID=396056 RepID=A0A1I2QF40_9BACI|nr:TatD family hydrolase [Halobacillus alkaliphilus]SFG24867.1 TatD DNase family protein [Halobacillus alkaliphilus]